MKNIIIFTGNRADYGLLRNLIKLLNDDKEIDFKLIISGSHLSKNFGATINEINRDNIKNRLKIKLQLDGFNLPPLNSSVTKIISKISLEFENKKPDLFIVLGDRYETFGAAIASFLMQIPLAHIHGGESTHGAIDDRIRHSITQLSKWHFTSAELHKKKVIEMGQPKENVYLVGPMALDSIFDEKLISKSEFSKKTNYQFGVRNFLVTFHPETLSKDLGINGFKNLIKSIKDIEGNFLFTYPNPDPGGEIILEKLKEFIKTNPQKFFITPSLGQNLYINAMRNFDLMIGNSSSGIIEGPLIGIPVLNLGNRQKGRYRFGKVYDLPNDSSEIESTIKKILKNKDNLFLRNSFKNRRPSLEIYKWIKRRKISFKIFISNQ